MSGQEDVRKAIEALRERVSKIRRVKAGDLVLASDHNEVVACLRDALDLLAKLPVERILPVYTGLLYEDGSTKFIRPPAVLPLLPPRAITLFYEDGRISTVAPKPYAKIFTE